MAEATNIKITRLETEMKAVTETLQEIKADIKDIKDSIETKFVTKDEFMTYKTSQVVQKVLLSIITLVFGSLLGFFVSTLIG